MLDVSPNSSKNKFRRARVEMLSEMIDDVVRKNGECRIIDIGGTENFWSVWQDLIDWTNVRITCVNHDPADASATDAPVVAQKGDARDLSEFADNSFDIVFSNSVIEHVGRWSDMEAMAANVRRLAPRYLVQTPYFWFPIEPHARTPLLHWVPHSLSYRIVMMKDCGSWKRRETVRSAILTLESAVLLDEVQMKTLFPDARLVRERAFGLVKSLISVKSE